MPDNTVQITVDLTEMDAWSYAQFLKRVTFSDYRRRAVDDEETYRMLRVSEQLREALREAGYAPR